MSIRAKLFVLVGLPLLALSLLALDNYRRTSTVTNEMHQLKQMANICAMATGFVHESQKERGTTALFLGSDGDELKPQLQQQWTVADEKVAEFNEFLSTMELTDYPQSFRASLNRALASLKKLEATRQRVSSRSIPTAEAIAYYTQMNGEFIDSIGTMMLISTDAEMTVRISAYMNFLKAKELAGVERAVLSATFARDSFAPGMLQKFISLVSLQDSYLKEFQFVATAGDRLFLDETLDAECVSEVARYRQKATDRSAEGGFEEAAQDWFATATERINLLKKIEDYLAAQLTGHATEISSAATSQRNRFAGFALVVIGATAIGGYFVIRAIRKSLQVLTSSLGRIAKGDLTRRLDVSRDELGEVSSAVNTVVDALTGIVADLSSNAMTLDTSSTGLAELSDRLAAAAIDAQQQSGTIAAAAEEMSVSMSNMASTTTDVSSGVKEVATAIEGMTVSIQEVETTAEKSAGIAKSASDLAEASNENVNLLHDAATEIGKVTMVIEDIAEQTNLLALNATIEAARAGDAGKGFAVVATEVKDLARQTASATEEIRGRIERMQQTTGGAVKSIGEIAEVIGEVREASNTIAAAVEEQSATASQIKEKVANSADAVETLAVGVRETATASGEITSSMSRVDRVLQETSGSAKESRKAGEEFSELASVMKQSTLRFTLAS